MFVTGMTWMPIPFSILTGIIAELVYWSGGYKSMRSAVLAAGALCALLAGYRAGRK